MAKKQKNIYGRPITAIAKIFTLISLIGVFFARFFLASNGMAKEIIPTAIVVGVIFLLFIVIIFFLMREGKKDHTNKSDDLDS